MAFTPGGRGGSRGGFGDRGGRGGGRGKDSFLAHFCFVLAVGSGIYVRFATAVRQKHTFPKS